MRKLLCLFFFASIALCADGVRLTADERRVEVEWLASLGLKVPEGGPLVEQPFGPPWTRRSFVAPTAWWRAPGSKDVRADLLKQDLPLLRMLMEKAYGGWDSAARRGWNWDQWFADWDRDLTAKGDLELPSAFAPFTKLMDFQLDNHTGFAEGVVRLGSIS